MNTYLNLWYYLAEFFLEWEMLQTNVVETIKTHSLYLLTSFWKSYWLSDNVKKYGRTRQATGDCIVRRMRFAC
jgi:hypothetical protein